MSKYLIRRVLTSIPLLLGISIILFGLIHLAPGGPLAAYAFVPNLSSRWLRRIELVAIRAGYFFEPTPVPSEDDIYHRNIFDADMDVVSTGLQFDFSTWDGWLQHSVEAYYQIHLLRERYIPKEEDLWFGAAEISGHVWSFGASFTTSF